MQIDVTVCNSLWCAFFWFTLNLPSFCVWTSTSRTAWSSIPFGSFAQHHRHAHDRKGQREYSALLNASYSFTWFRRSVLSVRSIDHFVLAVGLFVCVIRSIENDVFIRIRVYIIISASRSIRFAYTYQVFWSVSFSFCSVACLRLLHLICSFFCRFDEVLFLWMLCVSPWWWPGFLLAGFFKPVFSVCMYCSGCELFSFFFVNQCDRLIVRNQYTFFAVEPFALRENEYRFRSIYRDKFVRMYCVCVSLWFDVAWAFLSLCASCRNAMQVNNSFLLAITVFECSCMP